jgi:hypothetical protein
MKFMAVWTIRPEHQREAIARFLKGGAPAPEGMTILGRWHVPGSQRGFVLIETDDLTAHGAHMVEWGNNLELEVYPVYEDADAGMAMTKGVAAADSSQ